MGVAEVVVAVVVTAPVVVAVLELDVAAEVAIVVGLALQVKLGDRHLRAVQLQVKRPISVCETL